MELGQRLGDSMETGVERSSIQKSVVEDPVPYCDEGPVGSFCRLGWGSSPYPSSWPSLYYHFILLASRLVFFIIPVFACAMVTEIF